MKTMVDIDLGGGAGGGAPSGGAPPPPNDLNTGGRAARQEPVKPGITYEVGADANNSASNTDDDDEEAMAQADSDYLTPGQVRSWYGGFNSYKLLGNSMTHHSSFTDNDLLVNSLLCQRCVKVAFCRYITRVTSQKRNTFGFLTLV